jgi:hypothetical protein
MKLNENYKLRPEVKAKWVEALRSKKYKQGRRYLRSSTDAFCCLGVLYDILEPDGWVKTNGPYKIKDGYSACLSARVSDMVGLTGDNESCLSVKNDNGISFEEIADAIETNL